MTTTKIKHCLPCEAGIPPMDYKTAQSRIPQLTKGWDLTQDNKHIHRDFRFKNYYQTMAFVNAIAWMAHCEGHHPDLEVGYSHCLVRYSTHAINGLSENDFICAALVDDIFKAYEGKLA